MVRSDGNGSYIVDKWIWKGLLALVLILLGVAGAWGTAILTTVKEVEGAAHNNALLDAAQEVKLDILREQLSRMEAKLDEALRK